MKRFADGGPDREPGIFTGFRAGFIEAKGERGAVASWNHRREQIQLLRRHLGKTVEP